MSFRRRAAGDGKAGQAFRDPRRDLTHDQAKRSNIPTAELQSLVREEEAAPRPATYPRLKAEIDEDGWATLYSAVSRPFPKPKSGQIAVKVINHYGDEELKVYRT